MTPRDLKEQNDATVPCRICEIEFHPKHLFLRDANTQHIIGQTPIIDGNLADALLQAVAGMLRKQEK